MTVIVGEGGYRYRVVENWGNLPDGWDYREVGSVGVDSKDNVYVFNRGEHPMIVFDRDGNFLRSWGEGQYPRAHGLHIDEEDNLYLTDDASHTVHKCTVDGKVLLEIGTRGTPTAYMSGLPFHRCTHTALSRDGDIFVSDGYGNARVHKYSPDGRLLHSWGEPGTGEGQFNIVHNIVTDGDGWVYVADRENHRVQVFDENGRYETQWQNLHRPCALYCCRGPRRSFLVGELGPAMAVNLKHPNIGPRLSVVDDKGTVQARIGDPKGAGVEPGTFIAPHGIAVDSRGDIYIGEVSYTQWPQLFPGVERPTPGALFAEARTNQRMKSASRTVAFPTSSRTFLRNAGELGDLVDRFADRSPGPAAPVPPMRDSVCARHASLVARSTDPQQHQQRLEHVEQAQVDA